MSLITTKIREGRVVRTHCLSYKTGAVNFCIIDGVACPSDNGVDFKLPEKMRVGANCYAGYSVRGQKIYKSFRLEQITPVRLRWKKLDNQVLNEPDPAEVPVQQIFAERCKNLRKKNYDSESWFNSVAKDLGLFGYLWNHSIGDKYIVDFLWPRERVILEMDGPSHLNESPAYREKRDVFLKSLGYKVFHLNYPIRKDWKETMRAVLDEIHAKRLKFLEDI